MPINIVYEYAGRGFLRRFFSTFMRCIGALLIFIGLIASTPLLLLVATALEGQLLKAEANDLRNLGIATLIMVVSLVLGRWLLRGRRQPVLFLRRFGFVGATEALTFALANSIGHSWRLVTLDDERVAPVGAGRRVRWTSAIVTLIAIPIVYWVFGGGFRHIVDDVVMQGAQPHNTVGGAIVGVIVGWVGDVIVAMAIMLVVGIFFAVLAIFSLGSYISVRRAERSKKLEVSTLPTLDPMVQLVVRRSRRVLCPKLIVVRVAAPVWQETVRRLALVCSAIVIDISEPTPNLLWEIGALGSDLRLRWILVADQERLIKLNAASGEPLNRQLFLALDGQDVLTYASDRRGKKRFSRALRARLEQLS